MKLTNIKKNQNKVNRTFFNILLSIFIISSCIQIIPFQEILIKKAGASSTWEDSNWFAPENYTSSSGIDIIPNSGDLKLLYGQGLYVADTYNYRIVKTTMDGSIWSTYGGQAQFNYVYGICYDNATGFIYVADYWNHRIVKTKMGGIGWTTYGSQGSGTGQFQAPSAISYDNTTGYIYVADTYNHRIVKTKINGSGWTTYGSQGTGTGQFNLPRGLCYDNNDGFIYVADSNNARIVKTKIDGTGWTTYGSFGTGKGQFGLPVQIDYDNGTGYAYVVDRINSRIVKTMMNGSGWTTYGSQGSGKGGFFNPWGISYDNRTGYVYVADVQNNRIVKTMMNGSGWTTFGSNGNGKGEFRLPFGITVCESNYCSEGFLTSRIFDCGAPANFQSISWVADMPTGTTIKFQFRTSCNLSNITSKDFIGPDGTNSTYYTTSGSTISSVHNGVRLVQYRVNLTTMDLSKTPILKDVTIIYNLLPNQPILTSPGNNNWTNNNRTTFTWTFNDTDSSLQSAFQWQASAFYDFIEIDYDSAPVNSSTSSFIPVSAIPDGFWYWRVRTKDNDGGWGPFSLPWKIFIDTEPPTSNVTIPKNNSYHNRLEIITGTAFDPETSAGINNVEIAIKRMDDNNYWAGSSWTTGVSWLAASGTYQWEYNSSSVTWNTRLQYCIYSRSRDNITNLEIPEVGNIFTFDTDNPTSTIEIPLDNSAYNRLDLISGSSTDADGAGVKQVEILIKRLGDDQYWDGSTWYSSKTWLKTFGTNEWIYDFNSVIWTTKQQYIIYSRATDKVNNVEILTDGTRFTFDTDKPSTTIEFPTNNSWVNSIDIITGSATDFNGSGIDHVEITIKPTGKSGYWDGNSWNSDICWLTVEGKDNWSYDTPQIHWTTDTYYTIWSSATDKAGNNVISGGGNTFMFDNKPPEQSFSINNGEKYTNSYSITLSLASEDSGSGVTLMAFSEDGLNWLDWEPISSLKEYNLSQNDGEKVIYFRVQDRAGNIAEPTFQSVILDTIPPENSIVINENAKFTNSNQVSLSLNASDSLSGVSLMSFSFDSIAWTNWKPFNQIESITLPPGDGEKTVYFRVQDSANNSAIGSDNIILDTTPPHSLSILINNGATETDSTSVSFELNALDNTSGVYQMSFSTDKTSWSEWEKYTESKVFDLPPGDGEKVIYFRAKDSAGNIAKPVSSSIILKATSLTTKPDTQPGAKEYIILNLNIWVLLIIIIIILMILIAVSAILIIKRKKRLEQEKLLLGALIVKPSTLTNLASTPSQFIPAVAPAQQLLLPVSTATAPTQPPPSGQTASAPAPAPSPIQPPQPVPKVASTPQLPQLPPAQIQTMEAEVKAIGENQEKETAPAPPPALESLPTPTPALTTTPTPTPKIMESPPQVQPTVAQTPTVTLTPTTQPQPLVTQTPTISEPPKPQISPTPQQQVALAQQQPNSDNVERSKSEQPGEQS